MDPVRRKHDFEACEKNIGADQTAQMRSLVSTFVIRSMECVISTQLATYKINIVASLCN